MKYILSFLFSLFITSLLCAYELAPLSYYGLSYGMSPQEVNDTLIASNFITEAAVAESGTFYRHYYSDPELVYYSTSKNEWFNMAFTTKPLSQLYVRDASISFPVSTTNGQFKRMIVKMGEQAQADADPDTIFWTYRLYFDNERLFAISVRYEDETRLQEYMQLNPDKPTIHPGFAIKETLFDGVMLEIGKIYGGFQNVLLKQYNKIYNMSYNAYVSRRNRTEMTIYYGETLGKHLNFTISYIDSYLFQKITDDLQKKLHFTTEYPESILPLDL